MTAKHCHSKRLFPSRNGNKNHPCHFTKYIRRISLKVLGVELRPHDFRHSFITEKQAEGYSDHDIIVLTGHKDAKIKGVVSESRRRLHLFCFIFLPHTRKNVCSDKN